MCLVPFAVFALAYAASIPAADANFPASSSATANAAAAATTTADAVVDSTAAAATYLQRWR